jgi:hypothetical protein
LEQVTPGVHGSLQAFAVDDAHAAGVDVTDDAGNALSATRTAQAEAPSALLPAIVLVVGLAGAAAFWLGWRRLHPSSGHPAVAGG